MSQQVINKQSQQYWNSPFAPLILPQVWHSIHSVVVGYNTGSCYIFGTYFILTLFRFSSISFPLLLVFRELAVVDPHLSPSLLVVRVGQGPQCWVDPSQRASRSTISLLHLKRPWQLEVGKWLSCWKTCCFGGSFELVAFDLYLSSARLWMIERWGIGGWYI